MILYLEIKININNSVLDFLMKIKAVPNHRIFAFGQACPPGQCCQWNNVRIAFVCVIFFLP